MRLHFRDTFSGRCARFTGFCIRVAVVFGGSETLFCPFSECYFYPNHVPYPNHLTTGFYFLFFITINWVFPLLYKNSRSKINLCDVVGKLQPGHVAKKKKTLKMLLCYYEPVIWESFRTLHRIYVILGFSDLLVKYFKICLTLFISTKFVPEVQKLCPFI